MLDFLQKRFNGESNLYLYNATAEISNLPSHSFDVIISAQAFHLFNAKQAKQEFYRLIKKGGYILLLWYFIDGNSLISKKIRNLFYKYGAKENLHRRQKINLSTLQKLFYPNIVKYQIIAQFKKSFSNDEFINSMLSSSYAPIKSNANYFDYINRAQSIYDKYSICKNYIEYDFQIHLYTIQGGK
jgi:ubiquinone/menaquinone biosynthesis C-methylase UbiE